MSQRKRPKIYSMKNWMENALKRLRIGGKTIWTTWTLNELLWYLTWTTIWVALDGPILPKLSKTVIGIRQLKKSWIPTTQIKSETEPEGMLKSWEMERCILRLNSKCDRIYLLLYSNYELKNIIYHFCSILNAHFSKSVIQIVNKLLRIFIFNIFWNQPR